MPLFFFFFFNACHVSLFTDAQHCSRCRSCLRCHACSTALVLLRRHSKGAAESALLFSQMKGLLVASLHFCKRVGFISSRGMFFWLCQYIGTCTGFNCSIYVVGLSQTEQSLLSIPLLAYGSKLIPDEPLISNTISTSLPVVQLQKLQGRLSAPYDVLNARAFVSNR